MLCVLWDACNSQKAKIFVPTRKKLALYLWHTWLAIYPNGRGETGKRKEKKDVKTMRVAKGTNLLKRSGKNLYFIQVKWKGVAKGRAKLFQFLFKTVEKFPKLFSKRWFSISIDFGSNNNNRSFLKRNPPRIKECQRNVFQIMKGS